MSNNLKPFTQLTMQIKLLQEMLGGPQKKKVGGGEMYCLPILLEITGKMGGSTVDNLVTISGETYSNVSRYVGRYAELGLIKYEPFWPNERQKYIYLTEKGEQFKQRLFTATVDKRTESILVLQDNAIEESRRRGIEIHQIMDAAIKVGDTGVAQPINHHLEAKSLEMKGEVGTTTVKITPAPNSLEEIRRKKAEQADFIKKALAPVKTASGVRSILEEYSLANNEFVISQILRAAGNAHPDDRLFSWRGIDFHLVSPSESLQERRHGHVQRIENNGVFMLYELGVEPTRKLPIAIQRDLSFDEMTKLLSDKEQQLNNDEIAGIVDVTFSGVMKELKELLNVKQYRKARQSLTAAVADFSHKLKTAQAEHEKEAALMLERSKANRANAEANMAHARHPLISQSERLEFIQRAHEAAGNEALNKEAVKDSEQMVDELQSRLAKMERMMAKLLAEKDGNKDG